VLVALAGGAVRDRATPPAWGQTATASAPAGVAAAARPDDELATAFDRFDQAGPANPAAVDDAAERFARLSAARPADPVLRAYAGAALDAANTTLLPWRKMTYTEDGLALIDKALAQLASAHDQPCTAACRRCWKPASWRPAPSAGCRPCSTAASAAASNWTRCSSPLLDSAPLPFRAVVWLRAARLAEDDKAAGPCPPVVRTRGGQQRAAGRPRATG
jgi:hypothetical protein